MAKQVPKSLSEAIAEEPDRFLKYFDVESITEAKNPYKEFLRQFRAKFGNKQGLYLWQYIKDNYDLTNTVYNYKKIQRKLPEEYKGDIDKQVVLEFFNKDTKKESINQKIREKNIKRNILVSEYYRKGKVISSYRKTQNNYSDAQKRFILARKELPNGMLADEFNRAFNTKITKFGIRDKKYRLLGKKT